jgi:hypothetical protein
MTVVLGLSKCHSGKELILGVLENGELTMDRRYCVHNGINARVRMLTRVSIRKIHTRSVTMKLIVPFLSALLLGGCYSTGNMQPDANTSHAHMGHVMNSWGDTPNKAGLLPTAMEEAKIAHQHAGFAAQKPTDLEWMKMHVQHVMHAMEPESVAQGPGLGYGLVKAANGVAKHANLAAASEDASANVKTHAEHVATSVGNAAALGQQIVDLGKQVQVTGNAADAAPLVERIESLSLRILEGFDADGDGQVTWSEGGLAQAAQHMEFMYKGEGMMMPGA